VDDTTRQASPSATSGVGRAAGRRDRASDEEREMTKSQLIDAIVQRKSELPRKTVELAVNAVFDELVAAMRRGERIEIRGFGNFTVRQYKAYTGRNPKTGDTVDVQPKAMPFFKVGKDLRDRINKG
jgi:integration host factor subunit beta